MRTLAPPPKEEVLKVRQVTPEGPTNEVEKELHSEIEQRAYEMFRASGCTHGHDVQDWYQAEASLLKPVQPEVEACTTEFTVRTPLPGFSAGEIELCADSRHLLLAARHPQVPKQFEPEAVRKESRAFKIVELPGEIDSKAATAFLIDGVVKVVLPRIIVQHLAKAA